jgi:hypothetical protein
VADDDGVALAERLDEPSCVLGSLLAAGTPLRACLEEEVRITVEDQRRRGLI